MKRWVGPLILAAVLASAAGAANPEALALVAQGKKLKREGKTDEAIRVLRDAVWKDRECVEAHYALGWLFLEKRDAFRTKWHFDHVIELAPNSQMARESQRGLKKLAALESAPAAAPAPPPRPQPAARPAPRAADPAALALVAKGKKLKREGKIDEAIRTLREAVWKDGKCVEAHYALGWLFLGQRNAFGSRWHFDHVIELAPNSQLAREARQGLAKLASLPPPGAPRPASPAPAPAASHRAAFSRSGPPIQLPTPSWSPPPSGSPRSQSSWLETELNRAEAQSLLRGFVKVLFVVLMVVVTGLVSLVRRKFNKS